jgi:hypothetical protein
MAPSGELLVGTIPAANSAVMWHASKLSLTCFGPTDN